MKKLTILAALCALLLGSCAENNLDGVTPENTITLPDLTAGFADDDATKTYVEENKYLRWHEADLISAFLGNTLNRQYKFKGKTGDNSGTFSLVPNGELGTGNALDAIYAVYPYDENATITDKGEISLSLPATQLYAENSFGKGANTMIAVTENVEDTFLGFKNACGYLKLKLYNESGARLKSVEVRGNNSEKIAGSATATMEFGGVPTLAMNNDATTTVTLDCGEGVVLGATAETATELWIVLPETTFEGGITITATDTEGLVFEKSTSNPIVITRNEIQPMKALEAVFEVVIPETWKIYYTATAKVTPTTRNFGGPRIVSNEWDSTTGKGVIKFDHNVTSIGEHAFYDNTALKSIVLPNSITCICKYAFEDCASLESIFIPESVTSISERSFKDCTSLEVFNGKFATEDGRYLVVDGVLCAIAPAGMTEFVIPNNVTSIGQWVFSDIANLKKIIIPDATTSINHGAFSYCNGLESITIPQNVAEIGNFVLFSCNSLQSIYCKSLTPPRTMLDTYDSNWYLHSQDCTIYVPSESVEAYKTAEGWSKYASRIVGYNF